MCLVTLGCLLDTRHMRVLASSGPGLVPVTPQNSSGGVSVASLQWLSEQAPSLVTVWTLWLCGLSWVSTCVGLGPLLPVGRASQSVWGSLLWSWAPCGLWGSRVSTALGNSRWAPKATWLPGLELWGWG